MSGADRKARRRAQRKKVKAAGVDPNKQVGVKMGTQQALQSLSMGVQEALHRNKELRELVEVVLEEHEQRLNTIYEKLGMVHLTDDQAKQLIDKIEEDDDERR